MTSDSEIRLGSPAASPLPQVTRENITIAITVFDRHAYLPVAIASALRQRQGSLRPEVMVVEDCGPDPTLRDAVLAKFGDCVTYHRNPRRRGLFDNWNACLEFCRTPWLCILHDDDLLAPTFVESMAELAAAAPNKALYYGSCHVIDACGQEIKQRSEPARFEWRELPLEHWVRYDPVCFPGQLINTAAARAAGGFRANSRYCADWEMWFKLAMTYGAAATNRVVASYREHHSTGRGTTDVDVSGKKYALVNVQRRRHAARLKRVQPEVRFARRDFLQEEPMPSRFLLEHGSSFSARMLRYNAGLFLRSRAPHLGYWLLQKIVCLAGGRSLRPLSFLFRLAKR